MTKSKVGTEEFNNALTGLTHDMVTLNLSSRDLVNMTEEEISLMYKDAGVTNYTEMAKYSLAKAIGEEAAKRGVSIQTLLDEGVASSYTKEQLVALMYSVYNLNKANLDGSQKIAELKKIYLAAGMTKAMLESVMGYTTMSGQAAADYLMENEDQWRHQKNVNAVEKTRANGGKIYVVIQKKQGAESCLKAMKEVYTSVDVIDKDKGYFIIKSIK